MAQIAELHVAPKPAAFPGHVTSQEKQQRLYELMLQYQLADAALRQTFTRKRWSAKLLPSLDRPAICAGIFAHLRAGDSIGAASYAFAANVAAGAPLASILRNVIARAAAPEQPRRQSSLAPAAALAVVTGAALVQKNPDENNVVIAFPPREFWRKDKVSAAVLRWAAEKRLPIVYVTVARDLPKPGESQSAFGLPQIAVDANDVVAVYRVAEESIHRARTGIGPTWMQCVLPEKTSDEPLAQMQKFLEARGRFEPARKAQSAKIWRDHWKIAWQAASRGAEETVPALPIASWSALG